MADAWKVGITLALTNNVSAGLAVIASEILGMNGKVDGLIKKFGELDNRMKLALGGGVAVAAGAGILETYSKVAEAGEDLLDQQDKLLRANVAQNDVLRLTQKFYTDIASTVPTASVDEYLKTYNELRSVVGAGNAEADTPFALKLDAIIANMTGSKVDGSGFNIYRALEMRGTTMTDPQGSQALAMGMAQDIVGSAGKITADTYFQIAKRAGSSWMQFDPKYILGGLSVAAGDMGGDTAGTAAMSLQQFLTGAHTLSKQQYQVLRDAGLIDTSKVSVDKGGRINMAPGAIAGSAEGAKDQYHWAKDVMGPALMNLAGGDKAVFDSLIAKLGSNRNVTRMLAMFTDPGVQEQIEKDISQWSGAKNINDAYGGYVDNNPKGVEAAYEAQKRSMMEAIGAPLMQAAIPVMKQLTSLFSDIGRFANANGPTLKVVGEGLLGLGVALAGLGTAGILMAGVMLLPGGLVVTAVAAIGGIIASVAAFHWQDVKAVFDGILSAITGFLERIQSIAKSLLQSVLGGTDANSSDPRAVLHGGGGPSGRASPTAAWTRGWGAPALNIEMPPPQVSVQTSTAPVVLDSRTIGQIVTKTIVKGASTVTGPSNFDQTALPRPTGQ